MATLPSTPVPDPHIGRFVTHLVGDLLARHLGLSYVAGVNLLGRNRGLDDPNRTFQEFRHHLGRLKVEPQRLWRDDHELQRQRTALLASTLDQLATSGAIFEEVETIHSCPCGAVEIPERALAGGRHPGRVCRPGPGDELRCTSCRSPASQVSAWSLYLRLPALDGRLVVLPAYAHREIHDTGDHAAVMLWRISRRRPTPFPIEWNGRACNLDVDFAWGLFPTLLAQEGLDVVALVSSNRTIEQAVRTVKVNAALGRWPDHEVALLVTPYFLDGAGGRMGCDEYSARRLGGTYDARALRLWLSQGLHWDRKNVNLPTRELHWALQAVNPLLDELDGVDETSASPGHGVATFLEQVNGSAVRACVVAARKGGPAATGACLRPVLAWERPSAMREATLRAQWRPLTRRLAEALGSDLVAVLLTTMGSDCASPLAGDPVIVLREASPLALRGVRSSVLGWPPGHPHLDVVDLSDVAGSAGWSREGDDSFAVRRGAVVLYGHNPYAGQPIPSPSEVRWRAVAGIERQRHQARVAFARSGAAGGEVGTIARAVAFSVENLLELIGRNHGDVSRNVIELLARFPKAFGATERESLARLVDAFERSSADPAAGLEAEPRSRLLEDWLTVEEAIHAQALLTVSTAPPCPGRGRECHRVAAPETHGGDG